MERRQIKENQMKDVIVGYGVVGSNLHKELERLNCDISDKYKNYINNDKHRLAFICVPTPLKDCGFLDIKEVVNAIEENDAEVYVIKSTISVGATEQLKAKTNKRIVFSPEYYGSTQHCNNYNFDFT